LGTGHLGAMLCDRHRGTLLTMFRLRCRIRVSFKVRIKNRVRFRV